ncbi:hypothetical protein [Undibacterium sp.]|jgi:hypothetical protein|uniref:hypothetical protein n=1 Tax=Undibacterium sp. TaxID=1914977 RepID=UPI002CA02822|nr:hypothetical protein [Undibacterium sp.]HTD04164.1 hypothetical protein [Undibacterium sp.]
MNRQQQLLNMAARLKAAAEAKDWQALDLADKELAASLPRLAASAAWTVAERASLLNLRAIHNEAYQRCTVESARLTKHLSDMQANKEGWIAYALNGANDSNGSKT